jgi:hypothetical protein
VHGQPRGRQISARPGPQLGQSREELLQINTARPPSAIPALVL